MGKPTGFKEWPRQTPARRPVQERLGDWREVYEPCPLPIIRQQGGRCMDCGVPFCQQGCPLGNLIPDWNDAIYRDSWQEAWLLLASTNNFPELTGRLCPAPCEAACVVAVTDESVTIEQVEKEIAERAFVEGWARAQPPKLRTGKRVAVVGSGPAGLAAAAQLNRVGHLVTVLERADRAGGLLRYGVRTSRWRSGPRPAAFAPRLGRDRVSDRSGRGPGPALGRAASVLRRGGDRDWRPPSAGPSVPGRELSGVHFAMDYLEGQNRSLAGLGRGGDQRGEQEGGDPGRRRHRLRLPGDGLRQGAAQVTQIELLARPRTDGSPGNPWPQWPHLLRSSSSHQEGGERVFGFQTTHLTGEAGSLRALHGMEVQVSRGAGRLSSSRCPGPGASTRRTWCCSPWASRARRPIPLVEQLGVELDGRGNVRVDHRFATTVPGVLRR